MGTQNHGAIMPAVEPLALSPRDAAAYLSVSKRTLSRLISARKIAARKDGVRTLVDVASIKALRGVAAENRSCPMSSGARGAAKLARHALRRTYKGICTDEGIPDKHPLGSWDMKASGAIVARVLVNSDKFPDCTGGSDRANCIYDRALVMLTSTKNI
jgi:excisionase family DNA binding protein